MTGIIKTDQIQGAQGTTVTIPSGQKLGIGTSSPNTIVDIASDTSTLTLEDTSSHSANTGPAISFKSKDSGGTTREVAKIVGAPTGPIGSAAGLTVVGNAAALKVRLKSKINTSPMLSKNVKTV